MDDPLSRRALDRLRRLVRVLHQHDVDLDDLVLVTIAGIVVAIDARAYRDPLVVHEVVGAGPDATWPLSWAQGFLVLGILVPQSAPRLEGSDDDTPGAIPILVIDGDSVEVTFIAHEDLEQQEVPS